MRRLKPFFLLLCCLILGAATATAGEKPPGNALPLSQVIKFIEEKGYAPITDVSFDDRVWEVEAYKNNIKRELKVDPVTLKILSDRLDN